MTNDQIALLAVGGLAVACLVLLVVTLVFVQRLRRTGARSRAELEALRERVDLWETQAVDPPAAEPEPPVPGPVEFVITDLGIRIDPEPEPVHLDGPAFADIVLKETVVKAASLAHGLRRGLAPATRNRIRFEMKQEVRRARKQRRADLKEARRDLHARQRASLPVDTREAS